MKKTAKWIGIWLIWIIVMFAIMALIVEPIFTECYNDYYVTVVAERNELYTQVDSLENNFDEVYNMRNAEIINSEEPVIVLNDDMFTLNVKFNQTRTEVISIEEIKTFSTEFWIVTALAVATLLYLAYSIGKLRGKMHIYGNKKEAKVRDQE